MTDSTDPFTAAVRRLAQLDVEYEAQVAAGRISDAEVKAYHARRAEVIAELDRLGGTADVTYEQFRTALDAGADCAVLFELRNGMDPKNPLREEANVELRLVGCHSPRAQRRVDETPTPLSSDEA